MGAQQYAVFRLIDVTKLNNGFVCLKSWGKTDDMLGKPPFFKSFFKFIFKNVW